MCNKELSTAQESVKTLSVFGSTENFEAAQRMAKCLSASSMVPEAYRGDKGLPNCIIALEMSQRIGASPLMVMQNLYVVHGNPSWSAKFLIACLNGCGKFSPLRYEYQGKENTDAWKCRAYATDKANGETLYGAWVSIDLAKKEGWYTKSGSKWQTMPELMLQYRAAAFFQRAYAPEISMGLRTAEEIADENYIDVEAVDVTPTPAQAEAQAQAKANTDAIAEAMTKQNDNGNLFD